MSNTTKSVDDEFFGRYALIEMKRHGAPNEYYRHKVIGRFRSNTWVEVPIQSPATPTIHDHSEDVVNVICCGVIEETVYRVRLSDVKLDPLPQLFTKQLEEAYKKGYVDGGVATITQDTKGGTDDTPRV